MLENLIVRKELLEETQFERLLFDLTLDGKEYHGHYNDGKIEWLQMKPEQVDHEMRLEELDAEVKSRIENWKFN